MSYLGEESSNYYTVVVIKTHWGFEDGRLAM